MTTTFQFPTFPAPGLNPGTKARRIPPAHSAPATQLSVSLLNRTLRQLSSRRLSSIDVPIICILHPQPRILLSLSSISNKIFNLTNTVFHVNVGRKRKRYFYKPK